MRLAKQAPPEGKTIVSRLTTRDHEKIRELTEEPVRAATQVARQGWGLMVILITNGHEKIQKLLEKPSEHV
jgi:hypothetical protein